ncbi:MAG TPA: 2'-5' RNA ligase family protein [Propylenella sp.]|nr:2'-5' RNA ligase family protein [Propylenella sp.]
MAAGNGLGAAPFVLTLEMDGESYARFDELRRRYFPPERNLVPAHLTLFPRLPGERGRDIKALLREIAAGRRPIAVEVGIAKASDRGVAILLRSPQLQALRDELAREFEPWVVAEDAFRPHITIQNNVGPVEARRTEREIAAGFLPRRITGLGLHLWRYRDGPWEHVQLFRFRGG